MFSRRCIKAVFAQILAMSFGAAAMAQNLVVNGDFEDGINNWQWFGITAIGNVATTSTDTPSGSGNSADLDIVEALGLPWLIQDVDISSLPTGTELTLSAAVREVRQFQPEFDAWIASQMYLLPSSESGAILASGFAFYSSPTWQTQSFTVTKPVGANVARILFTPQDPGFGVGTGRYRIDNVTLTAPSAAVGGDYNNDGAVNAADYALWASKFGQPVASAGLVNINPVKVGTVIDASDYTFWRDLLPGAATAAAVPEPAGIAVLAIPICFASFLCRSRPISMSPFGHSHIQSRRGPT